MATSTMAAVKAEQCVTLSQATVGCRMRIRSLNGPGCQRLRELGFCESLAVVKLGNGRNLLCALCGTRLALSRDLADQVMVAPVA